MEAELLKKAFQSRIGKQDNESFRIVVKAFFEEYERDSQLIIPQQMVEAPGESAHYQPLFYDIGNGRAGLAIVSDVEYMTEFEDRTYLEISAHNVIQMMLENEMIGGLLINPFSDCHCFMSREDIFGYMDYADIDY